MTLEDESIDTLRKAFYWVHKWTPDKDFLGTREELKEIEEEKEGKQVMRKVYGDYSW